MLNNTNKSFLFLFIIILGFVSCRTTKKLDTVNTKLENALLWKIEGNGLDAPSYLFGTIHMINKDDYFLPNGLIPAIESVEKLYFEIDIKDMSDMSKLMGLMQKAMMTDNLKLSDLISEEDYALVKDHFKKLGLPLMMLERLKPMFLEAFVGGDINPGDLQSGKIKSYEFELNTIAEQNNIPTAGLETIEFQLSIFDSIPYKMQAKMLVDGIKSSDEQNTDMIEMVKIYKEMNIEAMVSMIENDENGIAKFQDILLDNRNKKWIDIMILSMKTEPCLFAVGAGHLAGNNGVIQLLRHRKYKLTPVLK